MIKKALINSPGVERALGNLTALEKIHSCIEFNILWAIDIIGRPRIENIGATHLIVACLKDSISVPDS